MIFKNTFKLALLILMANFFSACSSKTDAELITEVFQNYTSAIKNNQGMLAAEYLDQKTLDWFDKLLDMSLNAPKSELQKSNMLSKVTVLSIRQEHSKKEIKALNNKAVFAFALDKDLYHQDSTKQFTIANLKIGNPRAVAAVNINGKEVPGKYIKFLKDKDGWKLNFAAMINILNDQATGRLVENIPAENRKAIHIVRKLSNKPIKRNIWKPAKNW
ncbi:MAG TPA: hypothetical protein ENK52_02885 [Saprospiraceae bacterium]|nr:hypothetical protein [Saprospiraceae bacterium]